MELGKILSAVKTQLIIIIVLDLIVAGLQYSALSSAKNAQELALNSMYSLAGVLGLVAVLVIVWAGFAVAKQLKGSVVDAGLGGALVAVISGIIGGVINLILIVPLMTKFLTGEAAVLGAVMSTIGVLGLIVGIIGGAIIGFILGIIGGIIGGALGNKK